MRDISYHKTLNQDESAEYVFSGTFELSRLRLERSSLLTKAFAKFGLLFICLLGTAAAMHQALVAYQAGDFASFTGRNPYNLLFWAAVLCGMYFWSWMHDEELKNKALRYVKGTSVIDIYQVFDYKAKRSWNRAFEISLQRKKTKVDAFDLLSALLEEEDVRVVLYRLDRTENDLNKAFSETTLADSIDLMRVPYAAMAEALKLHDNAVDSLMLFSALLICLPENHPIKQIFFQLDLSLERIEIVCTWQFNLRKLMEQISSFHRLAGFKPDSEINRGFTSLPTPSLDRFSQDLTSLAKHSQLPIAVGRESDLQNIFTLLSEGRRNLLIKAPEGTGRTTVLNELAYKMVTEDVPELLQDKRLVKLELSNLVGSHLPAEEVLVSALQEADYSGNIVLVLEEIHVLAKAQSSKGLSLLEVLLNYLQQSSLVCFATTTPYAYIDDLHHALNFDQIFASYELQELSKNSILLASCVQASFLEGSHDVFFTYTAIEKAVELTDLYVKDQGQPQKTINVLTEAAVKMQHDTVRGRIINAQIIEEILSQRTHIPEETFSTSEADKLLHLEEELAKDVIGQSEAVKAVAEVLRRARSGLTSESRPLASLLFVGPTGVGKTELAKTLARVYFGKEEYFLRLDMSEYQGGDGVQKLLGASKNEADSIFVKHIKNYPFCLFLLDEFEKSSPEVRNIFLQILDDGRATTVKGETLDLTHTMVIATSNAGTAEIESGLQSGLSLEKIKTSLFEDILLKHFSPELLNRFDAIILFTPLSPAEVEQITMLQLQHLAKQLQAKKALKFEYTPAAVSQISSKAFDPLLGARPIRRYIQDHVENLIAKALLQNQYKKGATITLDIQGGEFVVAAQGYNSRPTALG